MSAPVLKKVHTFADDLERARGERGIVAKSSTPEVLKQPTKKMSPGEVMVSPGRNSGPNRIITASSTTLKPSANDLPATIITDQRGKRFNLTSEMSSAIGEWWSEKVKSVKKTKQKNLYGLPSAERRKGVVTAATTHTGRQAGSDYHAVVERVKAKPEATVPIDGAPERDLADSYVTATEAVRNWETNETGDEVSTADDAMIPEDRAGTAEMSPGEIQVTDVTYRQPRILPTIPDFIEDETSELPEDELASDSAGEEEELVSMMPTGNTFEKINPAHPERVAQTPSSNAFTMLGEIPIPTLQNKPDYVKTSIASRKEAVAEQALETKAASGLVRLVPYLAGGTFVVVTVGTIAYFMMAGSSSDTPIISDTNLPTDTWDNTTPQPLDNQTGTVTAQLDAPNKTSLYNAIEATANQGESLQLVVPLAHDTALPLSHRELLGFFNRQFSPAFIGTVSNVRVGMYREEPVILLTVSDPTSARGSMFLWETTMSQDLSPWFGLALSPAKNQSGSTFVDSKSAGYDVRVLKDDLGTERITYGILGQSTILITTNSTAFLNVTENYNVF